MGVSQIVARSPDGKDFVERGPPARAAKRPGGDKTAPHASNTGRGGASEYQRYYEQGLGLSAGRRY